MTSRGELLALVTLKHSEAFNLCEVSVCIAVQAFDDDYQAARAIIQLLLCDAAKCGGSMAIQFTSKCADGKVPGFVVSLASSLGVELQRAATGSIAPDESRALFLALAGLSPAAVNRVRELHKHEVCSIERICYLIQHGIWATTEADEILLYCPYPDLILGAFPQEESGGLHDLAAHYALKATMMGAFSAVLRSREDHQGEMVVVRENEGSAIEEQALPELECRAFRSVPLVDLGLWKLRGSRVIAGNNLVATAEPKLDPEAIKSAVRRLVAACKEVSGSAYLLLPQAIWLKDSAERAAIIATAVGDGVEPLACPAKLPALELEIRQKRQAGRTVRR